jgi:signal transduction histidine kinase
MIERGDGVEMVETLESLGRQLARKQRELDAVTQITEAFLQPCSVQELVKRVLHIATDVVGADAGSLLLTDPKTGALVFRYVIGEKGQLLVGKVLPDELSLAGTVFKSGRAMVIPDANKDARHLQTIDKISGYQTRDMIVLPLKSRHGGSIGVLEVLNKREGTLGEEDLTILTILAWISSEAIEGARLAEEAKLAEVVRLLGDIGHDVKNMLTPLVMGAGILQTEMKEIFGRFSEEEIQEARERCENVFGVVQRSVQRLHDRVKELADCVKGVTTPPQFAPCSVSEIVDSVVAALRLLAQEKGITLRTEGLAELPSLLADQSRLFNAFYNLINNAIPEISTGGTITIAGKLDSEAIDISVTDTGNGMPPAVRDSLFSLQVISRKAGGTGLGTKIVKDVIDAHGGMITVESEEGAGTTFRIRLPLRDAALLARQSAANGAHGS